jgi:hypothetical protein
LSGRTRKEKQKQNETKERKKTKSTVHSPLYVCAMFSDEHHAIIVKYVLPNGHLSHAAIGFLAL